MIVINGTINIDPACRADVFAAAIAMMKASNAEAGCHYYAFTADLKRDDIIHIAEKWTSEDDLKAHFAMPHMAEFQAAVAGCFTGSNVVKFQVSSEGPVR